MKHTLSVFFFSFLVLGLTACSGMPLKKGDPQRVVEPDRVTLRLAEAADRATKAMETLAEVEQTRTPVQVAGRFNDVPPELARTVTLNWTGPVAHVAKKMADLSSYSFAELGNQPPVPIVVNINATNRPIIDVLRDIGLQMGTRGSVVVDATSKVVEVNYASLVQ